MNLKAKKKVQASEYPSINAPMGDDEGQKAPARVGPKGSLGDDSCARQGYYVIPGDLDPHDNERNVARMKKTNLNDGNQSPIEPQLSSKAGYDE